MWLCWPLFRSPHDLWRRPFIYPVPNPISEGSTPRGEGRFDTRIWVVNTRAAVSMMTEFPHHGNRVPVSTVTKGQIPWQPHYAYRTMPYLHTHVCIRLLEEEKTSARLGVDTFQGHQGNPFGVELPQGYIVFLWIIPTGCDMSGCDTSPIVTNPSTN
jgi:hypothetical protein